MEPPQLLSCYFKEVEKKAKKLINNKKARRIVPSGNKFIIDPLNFTPGTDTMNSLTSSMCTFVIDYMSNYKSKVFNLLPFLLKVHE